jgi:hypothetical protein
MLISFVDCSIRNQIVKSSILHSSINPAIFNPPIVNSCIHDPPAPSFLRILS